MVTPATQQIPPAVEILPAVAVDRWRKSLRVCRVMAMVGPLFLLIGVTLVFVDPLAGLVRWPALARWFAASLFGVVGILWTSLGVYFGQRHPPAPLHAVRVPLWHGFAIPRRQPESCG